MRRGITVRAGIASILVGVLVVAAFPSSAQEDESNDWPETVVVIGDPPPSDHEGEYQEWECEGEQTALVVIDYPGCGDFGGEHVLDRFYMIFGFRSVHAGNYGMVPLTGTLRAEVVFENGYDYYFDCRWHEGEFAGCTISAPPVFPVGVPFEFSCGSLPGAIGGWAECYLAHGSRWTDAPK